MQTISMLKGKSILLMLGQRPDIDISNNYSSLDPPAPPQPASISSSSTDSLPRAPSPPVVLPPTPPRKNSGEFNYTPYKDDPDAQSPLDDAGIMLQQRMMMNGMLFRSP